MPGILKFAADDVRRVVEHAYAAKDWSKSYFDKSRRKPHPQIIFVHDEGLYLMSNGKPRDLREQAADPNDQTRSFCAYAEGFDPFKADDHMEVWDAARDVVGGDDFAEYLDLSPAMLKAIRSPAFRGLQIKCLEDAFEIAVAMDARVVQ